MRDIFFNRLTVQFSSVVLSSPQKRSWQPAQLFDSLLISCEVRFFASRLPDPQNFVGPDLLTPLARRKTTIDKTTLVHTYLAFFLDG